MRPRVLVIIIAAALALVLGFVGRATDQSWMDMLAGIAWLTTIVVAVSLLPFWRQVLPDVPALPGLFVKPGEGERWCAGCGSVTASGAACHVCQEAATIRAPRKRPNVE